MPPRTNGLPRPVNSPVSESPSEKAIEMPAPIDVASPPTNA
jgi:predicted component of type VI protein secretion system